MPRRGKRSVESEYQKLISAVGTADIFQFCIMPTAFTFIIVFFSTNISSLTGLIQIAQAYKIPAPAIIIL